MYRAPHRDDRVERGAGSAWSATDDELVGWARARIALAALVEFAEMVRPFGIRLMAIKGAHIHAVAQGVLARPMADVDAMLIEGRPQLLESLLRAGTLKPFVMIGFDEQALHVQRPGCPFVLDVHVRPFPSQFAALSNADLRQRARDGGPLLGRVVQVPDPVDGVLLMLVHYAKDRLNVQRRGRVLMDLDVLSRLPGFDVHTLVERATRHHVRALVTLALLDVQEQSAIGAAALEELLASRWDRWWPTFARWALKTAWMQRGRRRGYWVVRAVRDDGWDLLLSLGWQASAGLGRRWERMGASGWLVEASLRYALGRLLVPAAFRFIPLERLTRAAETPSEQTSVWHARMDDARQREQLWRWLARIDAVARRFRVPNTCLYRAVGRYLALRAMGLELELVFGVRSGDGTHLGHAWTEFDGRVVPDEDVSSYRVAVRFPSSGRSPGR